jgi:V/A-type H+-transporting ATPase subunit A
MRNSDRRTGKIVRIAGPVVGAVGIKEVRLFDVVHVGEMGLIGEVIRLSGDLATIQVYENTSGLQVGEPVLNTSLPLVAELGPGLLGSVYDGLQRPLTGAETHSGVSGKGLGALSGSAFLERGLSVTALPTGRKWSFTPRVTVDQLVSSGDILGAMQESKTIEHRLMVPPGLQGRVVEIREGEFTVDEVVAVIASNGDGEEQRHEITLRQKWPVRRPRPYRSKRDPGQPLITGMRVIDTFFPVAKGGTAVIPGGFGTGKTVAEQSLARWADADVVVYVGCGERGNEMAEVLAEFPTLEDATSGAPLMDRTILIANTSNMPVAAREASIYAGVTLAEYYRDMGYDVVLLADSTSRWGEALREISGRLEEMPGEEGYPAYLAARLSEFYERSGAVICLGQEMRSRNGDSPAESQRTGSVTLICAVSPPGGDFSEPMTQNSLRVAGTFWGLDYDLSRRRHFPAINWTRSYTLYNLRNWYRDQVADDWNDLTRRAMALLQEEVELQEIVQLVGPDALADEQKQVLTVTRMLREDFLQQSAYDEIDRFCPLPKAYWMLRVVLAFHAKATVALKSGHPLEKITSLPVTMEIARMKEFSVDDAPERLQGLLDKIESDFRGLQ